MTVITPTLEGMLRDFHAAMMAEVHTSLIAVVVDYDPSNQTCSAQPIARQARFQEDATRAPTRLPLLVDVPVATPRGGGARLTMPTTAGDIVVILCTEHSIEQIMTYGGTDVDPLQDHRFDLSDGIAIPGVSPFTEALANAPTDRVSLGYDAGATVEVHEDEVRIGGDDATELVAWKSDLVALKNAISGAVVVPNDGGASLQSTILAALSGWPTGASMTKAK